jgi:hypothetical protein
VDRLEEVHRAASLVRLEMAEEVPADVDAARAVDDAGKWGD